MRSSLLRTRLHLISTGSCWEAPRLSGSETLVSELKYRLITIKGFSAKTAGAVDLVLTLDGSRSDHSYALQQQRALCFALVVVGGSAESITSRVVLLRSSPARLRFKTDLARRKVHLFRPSTRWLTL